MEGQDAGAKMEVDEDNNEKKESPTPKAGAEDAAEAKVEMPPAPSCGLASSMNGPITEANWKEVVLSTCASLLDTHGGPPQYLKSALGAHPNSKWSTFAKDLQMHFPKRQDFVYLEGCTLPRDVDPSATFKLSLWHLGWADGCSSKPPTFKITANQLLDEYLTNSVMTAAEPLLLYQGPEDKVYKCSQTKEPLFFSCYVKGAARATSLLMLAHVAMYVLKVDLDAFSPTLFQSMLAVTCRLGIAATDQTSIALENARLSARGSIRKMHDVITWASKLMNLKQKGLSPTEIIRRWNESSTAAAGLTGGKKTSVLALLDLPTDCMEILIQHISEFGPDQSAFTDKCFGNKKIMPGYMPRCNGDKHWQRRLAITQEGFLLFVRYVHHVHTRKDPRIRAPLKQADCEDAVMMSQLLLSAYYEANEQHPLACQKEDILKPFLDGNTNLELDLQGAVSECRKNWQPADLACFKAAIAESLAKRDGKMTQLGHGPKITPGQLEKQTFELNMTSMQLDVDSYSVWRNKCADRDAALYFQRLQHSSARHSRAREIAESIFDDERGPSWMMNLQIWNENSDAPNMQVVKDTVAHIGRINQLATEQVRCMCILNWAAPAIFQGSIPTRQANLLGALANSEWRGIGAVLTPVHFYQKGSLYKVEKKCMDSLANASLNTDQRFALAYSGRNDGREKRSLLQPGILVMPSSSTDAYEQCNATWKGAPVMRQAVLTDIPQITSAEMHVIQDMSETALPTTTDVTTHASQVEKHQQIGVTAASKILTAFCSGLAESERAALLLVDLSTHTLEFAKAAYEVRQSLNLPTYYLGFSQSEGELEWQKYHLGTHLSEKFLQGSLPLPPGTSPLAPAELPTELVSALPGKPELTTLGWSTKKCSDGLPSLKTPDRLVAAWHDHHEFGGKFREWLSQTRDKGFLDIAAEEKNEAQGKKREVTGAPEVGEVGRPAKKIKSGEAEEVTAIRLEELPTPLCWGGNFPCGNKKSFGQLVIAVGKRIFICNRNTTDPLQCSTGTHIAGYYKGKWHMRKEKGQGSADDGPRPSDVVFHVKDADSLVFLDGKLQTLEAVVAAKRAVSPLEVKILYHDLKEKPRSDNAKWFETVLKFSTLFRPESAPVKEEQKEKNGVEVNLPYTSLAGCLDPGHWDTKLSKVVWCVKWTDRGLSPVRPIVMLTKNFQVPPGQAIELLA